MSRPPVQYTQTSDGVSIAFCRFADGPPLVFASNLWGDVHFYETDLDVRDTTDALCSLGWGVIRYDIRGMGLSGRGVSDFSLPCRLLDLDAVVRVFGLSKFVLAGVDGAAATASAYAARHPNRVSRLVLINGWVSGESRYESNPPARSVAATEKMAAEEWEFFTLSLGSLVTSFSEPGRARDMAASYRAATSAQTFGAYRKALSATELGDVLPRIEVPTLVVHDRLFPFASVDLSRQLAARVAGCRLVEVEGPAAIASAIDAFLRVEDEPVSPPVPTQARLTPREIEVLRLIAAGRRNREISSDLVLSERTVGRHITNIYSKIHVRSKAEATAYAINNGIV